MYFPGFTAAGDVDAATATSTSTACMGLGAMADAPTSPMFYSFINEAGPSAVPTSETVNDEFPFAPQQVVGIPQGTPTGPQPILYALGMGYVHALSWSLKTAAGTPVSDVGFADYVSASAAGLDPTAFEYLFAGVMIPPPLAAGTTYRGSVTWQGDNNVTATQTFSFTTAPAHNFLYLSVVKHAQGAGKDTTFIVDTGAPDPTLTLHGPNGRTRTVSLQKANAGSYMNFVLLANGHWSATAQSGGGSSDYALSVQHQSFSVSH
jgi:hypothetical protein